MKRKLLYAVLLIALVVGVAACGSKSSAQRSRDVNRQLQQRLYNPTHNVEFNNYNKRLKIADDPTTILWCTAYSSNPNVKPQTYPIQGKLTSSGKRPYNSAIDPQHMYGKSDSYRYGFTPAGVYVDFTGIPTICTTTPSVYQATETTIVLRTDNQLAAASAQATAALKAGQQSNGSISPDASAKAQALLEGASK